MHTTEICSRYEEAHGRTLSTDEFLSVYDHCVAALRVLPRGYSLTVRDLAVCVLKAGVQVWRVPIESLPFTREAGMRSNLRSVEDVNLLRRLRLNSSDAVRRAAEARIAEL